MFVWRYLLLFGAEMPCLPVTIPTDEMHCHNVNAGLIVGSYLVLEWDWIVLIQMWVCKDLD